MNTQLHFNDADWQRITTDWTAWWQGELARPMVVVKVVDPPAGCSLPEAPKVTANLPWDMPVDAVLDRYQVHLESTFFYGDAWPSWRPVFGPVVMAGFLGARGYVTQETVWFEPAHGVLPGDLRLAFTEESLWWQRIRSLTARAALRWQGDVSVGFADLVSNLDVLSMLFPSEQLLTAFYDAPDEIERLVRETTRLWQRYYDELARLIALGQRGTCSWANLWTPGRGYVLQCDYAALISPRMLERYVLPDLDACSRHLDQAFYHMDGAGQIPHLDALLALEHVRGIQWVPGAGALPPEDWLWLLKRIRDAGKLCQVWGATPEGALRSSASWAVRASPSIFRTIFHPESRYQTLSMPWAHRSQAHADQAQDRTDGIVRARGGSSGPPLTSRLAKRGFEHTQCIASENLADVCFDIVPLE